MNTRRPKRGQTEEELLREAEEWERANNTKAIKDDVIVDDVAEKDLLEWKVVERNPTLVTSPKLSETRVNPETFKIDPDLLRSEENHGMPKKKKSLFAMSMSKKNQGSKKTSSMDSSMKHLFKLNSTNTSGIINESKILIPADIESIQSENLARINTMSSEEIREQIESLSPECIAFFKNRNKSLKSPPESVKMEVEEKEEIKETKTETIKEPQTFVHMNKVETDKMEWMGELKEPEINHEKLTSGLSARFDLEGNLLAANDNRPVTEGLHNHGLEQERAGYTIDELLTLARSSNPQQKVIAFETLGRIVKNWKLGLFDDMFNQNLHLEILKSDIIIIIRTALDENNETLREVVCFCLRQMVENQFDELLLDHLYFASDLGHIQPSLITSLMADREKRIEYIQEKDELNDAKVIGVDVILGLLRIDILPRFNYLLNQTSTSPSTMANIFSILIRMARHSMQTASEILNNENLFNTVLNFFKYSSKVEKRVLLSVLKLLRILASWSKSLATKIMDNCDLKSSIPRFVVIESGDVPLTIEAFRLWDCYLRYSLLTDLYLEIYPVIAKYLLAIRGQIDITKSLKQIDKDHFCNPEIACGLFKCLEAIGEDFLHNPTTQLEWRCLKDLLTMIEDVVNNAIRFEFLEDEQSTILKYRFLSSCINCFNTYIQCLSKNEDNEVLSDQVGKIFKNISVTIFNSKLIQEVLNTLNSESYLFLKNKDGRSRDPDNLPSLGGVLSGSKTMNKSTFSYLTAFMKLLIQLLNLNKELPQGEVRKFLLSSNLLSYLNNVSVHSSDELSSNWFVCDEISFLYTLTIVEEKINVWESGLKWFLYNTLLKSFQSRHSKYSKDILFKTFDFVSQENIFGKLSKLNLNSEKAGPNWSTSSICSMYENYFPKTTKNILLSLTERNNGESLLPKDWKYLPILQVFEKVQNNQKFVEKVEIEKIKLCLFWNLFDYQQRSKFSRKEAALHYTRLSTTYLTTSFIYLDQEVNDAILKCLIQILSKCSENKISFSDSIPGVESFRDYYRTLLEQYFASSYGDTTFSIFILIPTLSNSDLKTALWVEQFDNLKFIRIKEQDLFESFPLESFWNDANLSEDILIQYIRAVITQTIKSQTNPVMFKIASKNIFNASTNEKLKNVVNVHKNKLKEFGVDV